MKNDISNMMALDIYLSSMSNEAYDKIENQINSQMVQTMPLLSWDLFSQQHQNTLKKLKRNQDIIKIVDMAEKLKWKNDIQSMFEENPFEALIVTDLRRNIIWVNDGFTEMTGYNKNEALNNFDDDTEFVFPEDAGEVINVQGDEDLNLMDLKDLSAYEDKKSYKYYFLGDIEAGTAALRYKKERLQYTINYDSKINPYLGVWITKGGFKDEYNCALEPSNGFYDSLDLAYRNEKLASLEAGEEQSWSILINIDKY